MNFCDKRFWTVLNALLALGILILLLCLLLGRWRPGARQSPVGSDPKATAPVNSSAVRREVDAGSVGVRPVSFTRNAILPDASESWRARGVQPQEWACLPASPGMDMAERSDGYLLAFSLPGVRNEDIRLSMTDRVVTVQAVIRDVRGNQVGGMERRVLLPRTPGDSAVFTARYTNGVLRICVAK